MKGIRHIFFDLDHTLWDYERSSKETLQEIYQKFDLADETVSLTELYQGFYEVNQQLWHLYNEEKIDRKYIKNQRFKKIFEHLNMTTERAAEASSYYMTHCATKPYLLEDARTALHFLNEKYQLHIITNGFLDSQTRKLKYSGIDTFFKVMVTSECINARKPSPKIFDYSLQKAGATHAESIMIGDNARTDISGAKNVGMKAVFYDPSGKKKSLADYTVQSHLELIKLF